MATQSNKTMSSDQATSSPPKPKRKVQKTSSRSGADRSADALNRQELARISSASSSYGASGASPSPSTSTGTTR
jgi:hypothetical protein